MGKKRGLNKGRVDLLLSEAFGASITATSLKEREVSQVAEQEKIYSADHEFLEEADRAYPTEKSYRQIPLAKLIPGKFQPRTSIQEEELQELAQSIKQQGILQPIMVREIAASGSFEIIAGERRWRAATIAGVPSVPVIVQDITDEEAMVIALVENMQRADLNPLEEAQALTKLAATLNLTHEELAKTVGKSRATVSNLLRLLHLHPTVQELLAQGMLDVGHAKVLLAAEAEQQKSLAEIVIAKQLSVRETERLLQRQLSTATEPIKSRPLDPDIARLQRSLSEKLGAEVKLVHHPKGRGKIMIKYHSIDELDGILVHLSK